LIHGGLRRAGLVACLVVCAACAQVALVAVTPVIAAFASHLDQASARAIVDLEKKQDWPGMLALAHVLLQREPERSDWWFLQGYAHARMGQHAEAVQSYERATRLSPEDEPAWLSLGQSQNELGQPERAIQAYKQALRFRPESAQAYQALGDIYQKQGKQDLAIANFKECVRYDPESAQGWYGLAHAYHLNRQVERRNEAVQKLRKLVPAIAEQFEKRYPALPAGSAIGK
jgi:tetratricopeptide (TPR) repeat protein